MPDMRNLINTVTPLYESVDMISINEAFQDADIFEKFLKESPECKEIRKLVEQITSSTPVFNLTPEEVKALFIYIDKNPTSRTVVGKSYDFLRNIDQAFIRVFTKFISTKVPLEQAKPFIEKVHKQAIKTTTCRN